MLAYVCMVGRRPNVRELILERMNVWLSSKFDKYSALIM